jgi:hypothetical protein
MEVRMGAGAPTVWLTDAAAGIPHLPLVTTLALAAMILEGSVAPPARERPSWS